MSIEDPNLIDFLSTSADQAEEELTISDHLDWTMLDEHLRMLQEKVYRYLDFIADGDLYKNRPQAKGRRLVIRIRAAHHAPPAAMSLIEKLRGITTSDGVDLEFRGPVEV